MKTALLTAVGVAFVLAAPLGAMADTEKAPAAKTEPAKPAKPAAKPAKPPAKGKRQHHANHHGGGSQTNDEPGVNKH